MATSTPFNFKVMERFTMCLVLGIIGLNVLECKKTHHVKQQYTQYSSLNCRKTVAFLNDYGGKGDGNTSNTIAFKAAIGNLSTEASEGGAMLVVPPGKWLTGSFNLISHFTLYLHHDAVILASQDELDYPLIDALPSYGRGRDAPGKRFASLIFGENLTDVVITGGNGTIEGQGDSWWRKFKQNELKHTRPYLIEIMSSNEVQITNITLLNSPSWNVHPVYCTDTIIENITIIAPVDSPNTDGINPDSCNNTRIRDVYIISGDDCIAVKSGWDEYGISYGMPTQHLSIMRLMCISPDSAVIALGSEMSGGIQDVRAEQIYAVNSQSAVRIKTARGRGGYIKDIFVRDMNLDTMKYGFWVAGVYNSHPDSHYDPNALPVINNTNFRDVVVNNVKIVGNLSGIEGDQFTNFCFSNVTAMLAKKKHSLPDNEMDMKKKEKEKEGKIKKGAWNCADISGVSSRVYPAACDLLPETKTPIDCDFPSDTLAIDTVELKTCSPTF